MTVQFSPDGKWYWDGESWKPVPVPPKKSYAALYWVLAIIVVIGTIGIVAVIGSATSSGPRQNPNISEVTINSNGVAFVFEAPSNCVRESFHYEFYDSKDQFLTSADSDRTHNVLQGHRYHVTSTDDATFAQPANSAKVIITPKCES